MLGYGREGFQALCLQNREKGSRPMQPPRIYARAQRGRPPRARRTIEALQVAADLIQTAVRMMNYLMAWIE